MIRMNNARQLAVWLDEYRADHMCCYGARGDERCDCKYGAPAGHAGEKFQRGSEQTGCPEMREMVEELNRLANIDEALTKVVEPPSDRCDCDDHS